MSVLSDMLDNPPGLTPSTPCTVGGVLTRLSRNDQDSFNRALWAREPRGKSYGYSWPSAALAELMTDNGYPINEHAIRRHRRRECKCPQI